MTKAKGYTEVSQIVAERRVIAKAYVDMTAKGYFSLEIHFPNGTFRKLYISDKALEGPIEIQEPTDSELYG